MDMTLLIFLCVLFSVNVSYGISQFGTHITCDDFNQCDNQHLIAGTECDIECITEQSCKYSQVTFSNNCDYSNLNCSIYHSCYESNIECAKNGYCHIYAGFKSMKRSTVYCPPSAVCIIHCADIQSCSLSVIHCDDASECFIQCQDDSCAELTIYAETAKSVQVICKNEGCDNVKLYCPTTKQTNTDTKCSFEFFGNGNEGIKIYAVNGISDVEIINNNRSLQDVTLFCNNQYTSNCEMSSFRARCLDQTSVCNHIMNGNNATNKISNGIVMETANGGDDLENTFNAYYNWIRKDNLLLFVIGICLVSCTMVCCGACCHAAIKKHKYWRYRNENMELIDSDSSYGGHSINCRTDSDQEDEYESDSISELEFIVK